MSFLYFVRRLLQARGGRPDPVSREHLDDPKREHCQPASAPAAPSDTIVGAAAPPPDKSETQVGFDDKHREHSTGRTYPRTTPGGYYPARIRRLFCFEDHPDKHPIPLGEEILFTESHARIAEGLGLPERLKSLDEDKRTSVLQGSWREWKFEAHYTDPRALLETTSPDFKPSPWQVKFVAHGNIKDVGAGYPWRRVQKPDTELYYTADNCKGHPAFASSILGECEVKALQIWDPFFPDHRDEPHWMVEIEIAHSDATWLATTDYRELVNFENAFYMQLTKGDKGSYIESVIFDAPSKQYWQMTSRNTALSAENLQWLGDNIWNIVHGFDWELH